MDPTEIVAVIEAIPELIDLAKQFAAFLNKASGNDPKAYVARFGLAMKQLNQANTDQERQDAAQALADAISGL